MNITVSLPEVLGPALRQRAAASGQDVASFLQRVITEELAAEPDGRAMSHDDFKDRLHQIIRGHGIRNGNFDDSRDSIYAGRGE